MPRTNPTTDGSIPDGSSTTNPFDAIGRIVSDHSPQLAPRDRDRRKLLKGIGALGATAGLTALAGCTDDDDQSSGRRRRPGAPVAGPGPSSGSREHPPSGGVSQGFAYEQPAVTQGQATHIITTAEEFHQAVDDASESSPVVAWIPPDAAIEIRRARRLDHMVIASTRSVNHPGGIIYCNIQGGTSEAYRGGEIDGMLGIGRNVRITGIRYRGPTSSVYDHASNLLSGYIPFPSGSPGERSNFYSTQHARGMTILSGDSVVDNCEIYGWPTEAIAVNCPESQGTDNEQSYPEISHSSLHDNMLSSAGYSVHVIHGHPHVYRVTSNATRHAIAGFGWPDCGYTLEEVAFGPANSLFQVDMHYLGENSSGGPNPNSPNWRYRGGGLMQIVGCTFTSTHVIDVASTSALSQGGNPFAGNSTPAIVIGGIPMDGVLIEGNIFAHPPPEGNPKNGGGGSNPVFSQGPIPGTAQTGELGFAKFDIGNNQYNADFGYTLGQG